MTPPRPQRVVVSLPEGGTLPAILERADERSVTLVLSTRVDAPLRELEERRAVVEYWTPTGIHRVAGSLHPDDASPEVLHLDREGAEEVIQRRDFARVDAFLQVSLSLDDARARELRTTTLNVSANGLLVADPVGLREGTPVALELHLGEHAPPVRARGEVVRETARGEKGIRLLEIAESDRERLVRFVLERERMTRRLDLERG